MTIEHGYFKELSDICVRIKEIAGKMPVYNTQILKEDLLKQIDRLDKCMEDMHKEGLL